MKRLVFPIQGYVDVGDPGDDHYVAIPAHRWFFTYRMVYFYGARSR